MVWISADSDFNPDTINNTVIGIASELAQHDSGPHSHEKGQLLFSHMGSMRIMVGNRSKSSICLLPPTRLAWIPPHTEHCVQIKGVVGYRSIYIEHEYYPADADNPEVLSVTPLLKEVLERIAFADFSTDWQQGSATNIIAVCIDELRSAQREPTLLPLPKDRRLRGLSHLEIPPLLCEIARYSGASEKTITRIMLKETGLSYQQWRQQWRLIKAIELLAEELSISEISGCLAFASESAFTTFFKNMTGSSPRSYMEL